MARAVTRLYGIPAGDPVLADIPVELAPQPQRSAIFAVPLAFTLARRLRKAPRVIAQEIAARSGRSTASPAIEATPNGYVNFFLDRPAFITALAFRDERAPPPTARRKAIVEHTAINPNKAAHIGHLRNAALGRRVRTAAPLPRPRRRDPELHRRHRRAGRRRRRRLPRDRAQDRSTTSARSPRPPRFDYYCWDLYARVTEWYAEDKDRLKIRTDGAARHRARRQRDRRTRPLHRRSHRPLPREDDGADEHRL